MLSVEWLDITHIQEVRVHRLPVHTEIIDHSEWIEKLLKGIGFDYRKGAKMFRVFGYSPKCMELFDE